MIELCTIVILVILSASGQKHTQLLIHKYKLIHARALLSELANKNPNRAKLP